MVPTVLEALDLEPPATVPGVTHLIETGEN
jgi:hypothetical protein